MKLKLLRRPKKETCYSIAVKVHDIVGLAPDPNDPIYCDKKAYVRNLIELLNDQLLTKLDACGPEEVFDNIEVVARS